MEKTYIVTVRKVSDSNNTIQKTNQRQNIGTYVLAIFVCLLYLAIAVYGMIRDFKAVSVFISFLSFWLSVLFLEPLHNRTHATGKHSLSVDAVKLSLSTFFTAVSLRIWSYSRPDTIFGIDLCNLVTTISIALFLFQKLVTVLHRNISSMKRHSSREKKAERWFSRLLFSSRDHVQP